VSDEVCREVKMSEARRPRRVAELLRARLAEALKRELADPRLGSLVITQVAVTDDLSIARVGVRLLTDDGNHELRRGTIRALRRASARLRRLVAAELRLRRALELRFEYDTGHDAARRVEQLLEQIQRER
jgi:ribosome-binding factor A